MIVKMDQIKNREEAHKLVADAFGAYSKIANSKSGVKLGDFEDCANTLRDQLRESKAWLIKNDPTLERGVKGKEYDATARKALIASIKATLKKGPVTKEALKLACNVKCDANANGTIGEGVFNMVLTAMRDFDEITGKQTADGLLLALA